MLANLHNWLIYGVLLLAVLTFAGTIKKVNPYGRHMAPGQQGTWPALPAWLLFESPQWFSFALTFWLTARDPSPVAITLFALWQAHYIHRAILYPLRMRDRHKGFPVSGVVFGFAFNAVNGFINGYAVSHAPHLMSTNWFGDPRFIGGLVIALTGWWINFQADTILINLRADGSTGYKIPYGGMFRYVSSANYTGEILLWCGWALMSFTLAGFTFAIFTISNLLPRALSHHRWYVATFPDYPKDRKALIPGVL
jgi:3-oxo-5-alpha-steroid 4-dehydrogenase 1